MKATSAAWYKEPKGEVHNTLVSVFRAVRDECEWLVDADEYHAGLYAASDRPGVRGLSRRGYEYGPATLPYNLCRSAVDTLLAKIATQRPLPQVQTTKGSWKSQKRARKMTQFLEGEFWRQRIFEKQAKRILKHALVYGRAVFKVWAEGDQIKTQLSKPYRVFVDPWEGDTPRSLYELYPFDRKVAQETWGRTENGGKRSAVWDALDSAGRLDVSSETNWNEQGHTVDRVDILEAWHLPSRPGADDGRHVVVCQGATLVDEPWEHGYFPFVVLNYNDSVTDSYWGTGLVEQLEGYQYEINLTAEKVSEQYQMSGVGVIVADGSHIHDQEIRNGITIMRRKAGAENPVVFQMDLVNEHMRQRPRELTEDGLNDAGLSQMSVQSQKPAGITAAVALQTLDDVETQRFMTFGRAWETFCLELAERFCDCAKQIADEYGDHAVSVPMGGGLVELSWKDVYVDGVEMRPFPASTLPQQPAARKQVLTDWYNSGVISRETYISQVMNGADLQAESDLETAAQTAVDEVLQAMLDADGDEVAEEEAFIPPSAYQPIEWGAKRATAYLNKGLVDGMPEFNQMLLRRWIKESDELLQSMQPAPPPGGPGALAGPGADMAPAPPPGASPAPPMLADLGVPGAMPGMA